MSMTQTTSQINSAVTDLNNQIRTNLRNISNELVKTFDIVQPWNELQTDIREIVTDARELMNDVKNIGVNNTIQYGMANALKSYLPFNISVLLFLSVIILVLPIIGNLYGFFAFLYEMIYLPFTQNVDISKYTDKVDKVSVLKYVGITIAIIIGIAITWWLTSTIYQSFKNDDDQLAT